MKPFDTIYMIIDNGDIIFPKSVQYYDMGYYFCRSQRNTLRIVKDKFLIKFNQKEFADFIRKIHECIYSEQIYYYDIRNINGDENITLTIHPNGVITNNHSSCTLYCPRNCLKWDKTILYSYSDTSYILKPCDENGKILEKRRAEINPYTNNCNIIYDKIKDNPRINTRELIEDLGWPPNSVTSRLSELMAGGRIYSVGRVTNPKSGRKVHMWVTKDYKGSI